jgi:hypothetical protein
MLASDSGRLADGMMQVAELMRRIPGMEHAEPNRVTLTSVKQALKHDKSLTTTEGRIT